MKTQPLPEICPICSEQCDYVWEDGGWELQAAWLETPWHSYVCTAYCYRQDYINHGFVWNKEARQWLPSS